MVISCMMGTKKGISLLQKAECICLYIKVILIQNSLKIIAEFISYQQDSIKFKKKRFKFEIFFSH
jgi:hypothetical protein